MCLLPSRNLHAVPDSLDDETAVFVEPTAAACRVIEQVEIGGRTRVGSRWGRDGLACSWRKCCANKAQT